MTETYRDELPTPLMSGHQARQYSGRILAWQGYSNFPPYSTLQGWLFRKAGSMVLF